jgi:hypothetical protein
MDEPPRRRRVADEEIEAEEEAETRVGSAHPRRPRRPRLEEEPEAAPAKGGGLLQRAANWLLQQFGRKRKAGRSARTEPDEAQAPLLRRHTDVSFPAKVPLGKTHNLRVQLVPAEETLPTGEVRPLPKAHPHDVTVAVRQAMPVTVSVAAEHFEIDGEPNAELLVPPSGKSAAVTFRLRGTVVGPARIMVDFSQQGRPVGSVDLLPEVVPAGERVGDAAVRGSGEVGCSGQPGPAPDVVIKVFEHRFGEHAGRLQFVLSSSDPRLQDLPVLDGDLGTLDLRSEVATWVEGRLRPLGALAERSGTTTDEVEAALRDVGCNLYDELLPPLMKDLFWTLCRRGVKSVLVLSDEPHIPWELIKPYRADPATGELEEEGPFWGEAFALTHWLRGRPPVQRLSFKNAFAVAAGATTSGGGRPSGVRDVVPVGSAALGAATEELAVLTGLRALGAGVEVLPARTRALHAVFERGGFDLLHLVCHGSFGGTASADASVVLMEDGTFSAAELSPRLAGALRRASPLIFFNACHSGRIGFALTRLGSWGARLVQLGCGGFVGALWPVSDEAALAFARAFYDQLARGVPIGEVMTAARRCVRAQHPNDPTWLAYRCFADPLARLETGPPA